MKHRLLTFISGFTLSLGAASVVSAGPLQRAQVAADAKWVLHLDAESLQQFKFGSTMLGFALSQLEDGVKKEMPIDIAAVIAKTRSITLYGDDFKPGMHGPEARGVVIWQGAEDIEHIVSGLLVQQAEASKAGQGSVKALSEGLNPTYSVMPNLFVAVRPGQGIVVAPQAEQIQEAVGVMEGKKPSLSDSAVFSEYPGLPGGFFFLALSEGFAKEAGLPPQAQVLKLAEGGRIALGEDAGNLRLTVNLKAPTTDNAVQIQQVAQGLVALASLAEVDEPELMKVKEWLRGAKVESQEKIVSLNLQVPVDEALQQISAVADIPLPATPAVKKQPAASGDSSAPAPVAPASSPAAR